ncbi:hypothetical protein [Brevundimonas sp. FT23028]|uniref:hypothetical protein n=1 Tax=Brevundimonas sp. FT23028 TaxID=3393748 RepID=UPI003B588426
MADPQVIKISGEDEAFAYLDRALKSEFSPESFPIVVFDGWPVLDVYLPKTPDASITPTMMAAFIEMQDAVYRTHKLINADTGNLRTLSKAEREAYEFRVRVRSGSSGYAINLGETLTKLATEAIGRMTPEQLVITVLGSAAILGAGYAWGAWLKTRAEVRKAEIEADADTTKAGLDQVERMRFYEVIERQTAADERKMTILAQALQRQPVLGDIEVAADQAKQKVVRAVAEEDGGGSVNGIELDASTAGELTSTRRQESVEVSITDNFRVAKVDTTVPDGFRVTLTRETGEDVVASVLDILKSANQRALLKDAEWNKTAVTVDLTARRLRSRIVDAVIVDVRPVQDNDESAA